MKIMKLTAENVENVFLKCLFEDDEPKENPVIAQGVMLKVGFNPKRLKENADDIVSLLSGLPDSFKQTKGGGMSFLNACMTNYYEQWGEHSNIDQLLCLGIAAGKAKMALPREMWDMFPGGMPYFIVLDKETVHAE